MDTKEFAETRELTTTLLGGMYANLAEQGWQEGDGRGRESRFIPIPQAVLSELRQRVETAYAQVLERMDVEALQTMEDAIRTVRDTDQMQWPSTDIGAAWLLRKILLELAETRVKTGWIYKGEDNPLPSDGTSLAIRAYEKNSPRLGFLSFLEHKGL